jgi:serine/threonine-protein kinase
VVLLKVLTPEAAADPSLVAWLEREAAAVAAVAHPNVVALYASGQEDGRPYLVTEFVEGRTLAQALESHGPLPPELAAFVAAETARGLEAAHAAGLLHRDLKPANVLLADGGRVKLADFGLATRVDAPAGEAAGAVRGTPGYLAPEAVCGEPAGPASDLFALGALLAEALTGRPAFPASTVPAALDAALHHDPVPALRGDLRLPAVLVDVVQSLVAKDPAARPTAAEVAGALDGCRGVPGTGFHAGPDALAAWLADPSGYRAARPVPPSLATAPLAAPEGGLAFVPAPIVLHLPAPDREAVPVARPRRGAVRAGIVAGIVVGLVAVALAAVRSVPDRADVLAATDRPDSLTLTLPAGPPDSLSGTGAVPLAAVPPETEREAPSSEGTEEASVEGPPASSPAEPPPSLQPPSEPVTPQQEPAAPEPAPAPPAAGRLVVAVQPWAEVFVDGRRAGEGSLVTVPALAAGEHRIELRNPEFPRVQRRVTVEAGAEERLAVSLWEGVARITLQVHPWAEVTVDGRAIGVVPPQRQVILAPGEHVLRLAHPSLGTWTGTVHTRAGETRTLPLNLPQLLGGS